MRNLKVLFTVMLLLSSVTLFAANQTDAFFVGKWEVTVITDSGEEFKTTMNIVRTDGKLGGTISMPDGNVIPINKIDEKQDAITIYMEGNGQEFYMNISKVDDNSFKGNIMERIDFTGKRIVE